MMTIGWCEVSSYTRYVYEVVSGIKYSRSGPRICISSPNNGLCCVLMGMISVERYKVCG